MNLCSPPTLISNMITSPSNHHQRKRRAQRTPSRTPSPPGHREPHPLSQQRSLELQLNSLQQAVSELKENQTILINNQQAVRQVLTTMVLPPYLATHLAPLYSLFNLSPVVVTDLPPHPLNPQRSPTDPSLNVPPPPPKHPPRPRTFFPNEHIPLLLRSLHRTPSSIYRPYYTLPSSNTTLLLPTRRSSSTSSTRRRATAVFRQPAQATTRGNRRHQPPTSTSPQTSTQIPTSPTFQASILSMSPPERLATLVTPQYALSTYCMSLRPFHS